MLSKQFSHVDAAYCKRLHAESKVEPVASKPRCRCMKDRLIGIAAVVF